jgi:hypothetical protein
LPIGTKDFLAYDGVLERGRKRENLGRSDCTLFWFLLGLTIPNVSAT